MTDQSGATPTAPLGAGWGAAVHFQPGQSFAGRYTVVEEVGAGGMGQVYKALDRNLGKTVALKVIRPETAAQGEALQRFRRELALAREVTHPNVCRLHDLGEVEGIAYISMEFVEGQTLDDLVQSVGHLSPKQTVQLARQICAGLSAIHDRGIVHRDLKPGNIMVDRSGHAVLMDFGMAYHQGEERLTGAGAVLGTLAYLSPEQARARPPDVRSDLYAVGLVLFEMLTGRRPPGDGGPVPLALRDSAERCPPPSRLAPEVPPALDHLVLRCLEREPARRYGTAAEVEGALGQVAASLSSGISSPLRLLASGRPLARRVALGVLAAAAAGAATLAILRSRHAPGPGASANGIAVLPLDYEGPPELAYLKDALPLLVSERLRAVPALAAAPFAVSRAYGALEDPRAVARQLGVRAVLQGRLRGEDGRMQATFRLSRPPDVDWSGAADGTPQEMITRSDEIARDVARALGQPLSGSSGHPHDPRALEHYLRARRLLEGWDVDRNYARAEEALVTALAAAPDFAEAHALLARALWLQYVETREPSLMPRLQAAAERAVALAPRLPEAQAAVGLLELARGRSAEAVQAFGRGLELAPADDALCQSIARAYASLGRHEEAERMHQRAIDLRPAFWANSNAKGSYFVRRGRLDEAKALFRRVIELRPESDVGYTNLAAAHLLAGEHSQAEPLLTAALRISPSHQTHNNLGVVYYATGRFDEAARQWRAAVELGAREPILYSNLGDANRQLGRTADAQTAYQRAIELSEQHLRINPEDVEARGWLGVALAGAGLCRRAVSEAGRAAGASGGNPTVAYPLAITYALCGDRTAALAQTRAALKAGVLADVRTNPDLRPLLSDASLQGLLPPGPSPAAPSRP